MKLRKTYELGLHEGSSRERIYWEDKIKDKLEEVKSIYRELYKEPQRVSKKTKEGLLINIRTDLDREVYMALVTVLNGLLEEE